MICIFTDGPGRRTVILMGLFQDKWENTLVDTYDPALKSKYNPSGVYDENPSYDIIYQHPEEPDYEFIAKQKLLVEKMKETRLPKF